MNSFVQGDHGVKIDFVVSGEDLTNASVKVAIRFNETVITKDASFTFAPKGKCFFTMYAEDIPTIGTYEYQWTVYRDSGEHFSGKIQTFEVTDLMVSIPPTQDNPEPLIIPFATREELNALETRVETLENSGVGGGTGTSVSDSTTNGNLVISGQEVQVYDDSNLSQRVNALETSGTGNGSGTLTFNTLADLESAYPNGTTSPVWITSENSWYYWDGVIDTMQPNDITNLSTSNITTTSCTLSWTASMSTDVTGYEVYQGTTLLTTVTGTSYSVSGLSSSTQYTFTIKAIDGAGNLSTGVSVTATTTTPDTTAPNDVTNLTTSNITPSSVDLNWTLSTSTDVANYEVAYSTDGTAFTVASSSVNSSSTSYSVIGLTGSTNYTFRAVTIDTSGNRSTGITTTATTSASDTTAPNVPTGLIATAGDGSVSLDWADNTETDLSGYNVYQSTDNVNFTKVNGSVVAVSNYNGAGLTNGTTYYFKVSAIDTSLNESVQTASVSASPVAPADTTPPTVTASPVGGTYTSNQSVTLTANETTTIYYTIDGTIPTESSTIYSGAIAVSVDTTIKYFAKDGAGNVSAVVSQTYVINSASTKVVSIDSVDTGYLNMPFRELTWDISTGYTDASYTTIITHNSLSSLFDSSSPNLTAILGGIPYTDFANLSTTNSEVWTWVGSTNKLMIKTLATNGTTALEVMNYLQNNYGNMKLKLVSTYKTFNVPTNVTGTTTRTATTGYEYVKCTLVDGVGTFSTVGSDSQFSSNGYEVHPPYAWNYTDPMGVDNSDIKINSDSTIEMQLPSGTLSSIDDIGVNNYLANASIIIYYN